jgi:hypothetical protein
MLHSEFIQFFLKEEENFGIYISMIIDPYNYVSLQEVNCKMNSLNNILMN